MAYINQRQSLKVKDGTACTPSQSGGFRAGPRDGNAGKPVAPSRRIANGSKLGV